ncbi:hypothetical protein MLB1_21420 [Mycobacteroides sp. LB1]|nr:hypothetical protein [Mycobacteroides sp. LB1]
MARHNNTQIDTTNQAAVDAYNREADQLNAQKDQLNAEADRLNARVDEYEQEFDRFLAQCGDYYEPFAPQQPARPLNSAGLTDLTANLVQPPGE